MKKSTLNTAILVGLVVGLVGCRGDDSNIIFSDRKPNDKFTQPPPHRIHQPNQYIVEDVNRKPSAGHSQSEEVKKTKPDPKKILEFESFDGDELLDERGYPRVIRTNNATINKGNKPGEPSLTGGGGNSHNTSVKTEPQEKVTPKFQSVSGAGIVQGTTMKIGATPTAPVNKGYSVHPLSNADRAKIERALEDTNKLRKEKGLPPLKLNESLNAYAAVRAQEISKLFEHKRPDGSTISSGGLKPGSISGENIAAGHDSADETVLKQWKNSDGHYRNIIDPDYQEIGIGYVHVPGSQYGYYWVQIFSRQNNAESKYTFNDQANDSTSPVGNIPNISKMLHTVTFDKDGKINLGAAKTESSQTSTAYQDGKLTHKIYKTTRVYEDNGYKALIQDPNGAFSYQTFGEVVDPNSVSVQFINIGQPTVPSDDASFEAHYSGASLGTINGKEHVYADVAADVNFRENKTMNLQFTNSKRGEQFTTAKELDFSEKLNWNDGKFTGASSQAHFYGPNGEEIGGHFSRTAGGGNYEGVFGLKKQ